MSSVARAISRIQGAQVMDASGEFVARDLAIAGERFSDVAGVGESIDASGLWVIPGVYDVHDHISWNHFFDEDRARRSEPERYAQTLAALEVTLHAGVVAIRDAGGAPAGLRDAIDEGSVVGPTLQVSVDMLGPAVAGDEDRVRAAVATALERGAQWIKLVATEGVSNQAGANVTSFFSDAEFRIAVDLASQAGARVMVHAWGGRAISAAIEAGVASIEHGIFLTESQARDLHQAEITLVPTLTAYYEVQNMTRAGEIPGLTLERIADVIDAHRRAVGIAQDAGVRIALGSDFASPRQHGRNLEEISALMRADVSAPNALLAATRNGAALLGIADGGILAVGALADAVVLTTNPHDPSTFESPGSVAAVVTKGKLRYSTTAPHHTPQKRSTTA